ncbi:MAG: hypothetical protein M5U34_43330 [Chloroflexi bacterium]|nr:hypothetical protein [Chloroflexota bacterium]
MGARVAASVSPCVRCGRDGGGIGNGRFPIPLPAPQPWPTGLGLPTANEGIFIAVASTAAVSTATVDTNTNMGGGRVLVAGERGWLCGCGRLGLAQCRRSHLRRADHYLLLAASPAPAAPAERGQRR